jgi:hypothetical protein
MKNCEILRKKKLEKPRNEYADLLHKLQEKKSLGDVATLGNLIQELGMSRRGGRIILK